jgi:hypothetical protein
LMTNVAALSSNILAPGAIVTVTLLRTVTVFCNRFVPDHVTSLVITDGTTFVCASAESVRTIPKKTQRTICMEQKIPAKASSRNRAITRALVYSIEGTW